MRISGVALSDKQKTDIEEALRPKDGHDLLRDIFDQLAIDPVIYKQEGCPDQFIAKAHREGKLTRLQYRRNMTWSRLEVWNTEEEAKGHTSSPILEILASYEETTESGVWHVKFRMMKNVCFSCHWLVDYVMSVLFLLQSMVKSGIYIIETPINIESQPDT